jgi:hypothetical protein
MVRMTDEHPTMADFEARMLADTIWLRAEFFRIVPVVTTREAAILAGISGQNAYQSIEQWRAEGLIFSVKRDVEDLYPAFQFAADMRPLPIIREILRILRQVASRSDWDNAMWLSPEMGGWMALLPSTYLPLRLVSWLMQRSRKSFPTSSSKECGQFPPTAPTQVAV